MESYFVTNFKNSLKISFYNKNVGKVKLIMLPCYKIKLCKRLCFFIIKILKINTTILKL